jgi:ABC-type sugar transport system substrate-binding protein
MNKLLNKALLLVLVLAMVAGCAPAATPTPTRVPPTAAPTTPPPTAVPPTEKRYVIKAIEKTLINEHWQFMKDGYEFAGERYGVDIEVGSVPTEADTAAQLALVESWLTMDIDALCVSPITPNNLNPALAKASEMGIPIINVDELIPEDVAKEAGIQIETRIASNNYYAGVLAGKYVLDHVDAGAKVAVMEGMAGNVSGMSRRDGFLDTVRDTMNVVAEQPGNWDRALANDITTNILQAHPDLAALYCANDTMALGAAEAIAAAGKEGEIILIGTDAIPEAKDAVKTGRMTGTVAQFPFEMGVLAVEAALKVLEGRPVAGKIDAPIKLLLKADVEKPAAGPPPAQPARYDIKAIEKTLINEHWQFMKDGYEFAADAYGVDVEVGSVPTEADTAGQLALVESWLTMDIDALCVSPITPNNLNPALAQASEMGIPIINVDELIPEDVAKEAGIEIASRIASNNYNAGVLAGKYMLDHLAAGAKVAVMEGMAGNVSGMSRRDGFLDTVRDTMNVVAEQPGNWDRALANDITTNILQAHPDLAGLYCANDTMALGAAEAIAAAGKEGEIILIGTDAIPEAKAAVKTGRMTGTVAQFPFEMGVLCVETVIKVLEGRPVADQIEAPLKLLLKDDV